MSAVVGTPYLDTSEWSEVECLPTSFAKYTSETLPQMAPAARGKTAFLQLHFQHRAGKTRLVRNFSGGHQVVRQVHHMDNALTDLAVVFIQTVSAGILQGDRLRLEVKVDDGARALVTTQAATKVFEMRGNYATQRIDITVGKDAYLEFLNDPLIVYEGARFYNEINLVVDPSGTLVYNEHLTPGRVAHGEEWAFEHLYSRWRCSRPNGELIVADTNVISPRQHSVATAGLFGEASNMGVMYAVSEQYPDVAVLADAMDASVDGRDQCFGGASVLPDGVGAHARVLGPSASKVGAALHTTWRATRRVLLDVDVPPIYQAKHGFDPDANHNYNGGPSGDDRQTF